MKYLKKIAFLFLIILFFSSCSEDFFEKPIDLDIDDHTSKLAGTAFLGATNEIDGTDDTNKVLVSFSLGPFKKNNNNQLLNNATVTLTGNNEVIPFHVASPDVFYFSNTTTINFIPNNEYTLTIDAPNYESIIATQIYPEKVPILEASINENTIKIKINDNPNQQNYYLLELWEEEGAGSTQLYLEPFGSLTKKSSFCYNCVTFNDAAFNGEQEFEIVVSHDSYNYNPDATYKAFLYHVTEDFYRYDNTLRASEHAEDNPFVEPVILHRNFKNGYGVFALMNKFKFVFNN